MSSPNLNLVTLIGSALNYISAFLFVVQEPSVSMETIFQVRISLLYLGVTLVFGPLLGKSWRLHRVFTHRVPDKRVIIKDVTLLCMLGVLLFADTLLLLTWVLSDPVLCVRRATASIRVTVRGTVSAVNTTHFCSSLYGEIWTGLLLGFKSILLIYGSYLAGLTNNISSPPVNQSLAIMIGNGLVIVGSGAAILVSRYFPTWPSLVYGVTSGSILVCTTSINCLIFIPQLLQSRQFEEEQSQSTQMAKYFSSPSKSFRSMYSEDQIYQLLGENTSMRKLLTEKNAIIESLQEQVSNAKDKLIKLLNSDCSFETIELGSLSALATPAVTIENHRTPEGQQIMGGTTRDPAPPATTEHVDCDAVCMEVQQGLNTGDICHVEGEMNTRELRDGSQGLNAPNGNSTSKQDHVTPQDSRNVDSRNSCDGSSKVHYQGPEDPADRTPETWEHLSRKVNYVSSEKLQEILKELTIESSCVHQSPVKQRRASHSVHRDPTLASSEGFRKVCISISPYMMRRRRGPCYRQRNLQSAGQLRRVLPLQTKC
ncbi:hypothetical protein GDO86_020114, partial [Hymenochirus boettgeri]